MSVPDSVCDHATERCGSTTKSVILTEATPPAAPSPAPAARVSMTLASLGLRLDISRIETSSPDAIHSCHDPLSIDEILAALLLAQDRILA